MKFNLSIVTCLKTVPIIKVKNVELHSEGEFLLIKSFWDEADWEKGTKLEEIGERHTLYLPQFKFAGGGSYIEINGFGNATGEAHRGLIDRIQWNARPVVETKNVVD